ncbi:MAG: glycosyltransferase, partial [Acidobacteriota bacterium]|nr:glycosyltransferase [Acidobacteriota bacterium]
GFAWSGEGQNAKSTSLLGFIFRRFDQLIAVNSLILEMFEKYGVDAEKTRLIYPFSLKRADPGTKLPATLEHFIDKQHKLLISVGLLETDYDLPLQIEAMEEVLKAQPATGLIIVGSGSLRDSLEDLIESKSYAENIILAGDTDRDVVLRLIERAEILLRTTVFDGDAISIHEALFLGTPVIATDNGMRPEGVTLIPVGGMEELVIAILDLLSDRRPVPEPKTDGAENINAVVDLYEMLCAV